MEGVHEIGGGLIADGTADLHVHPIVNLYRQWLELSLKDFVKRLTNAEPPWKHELTPLWNTVRTQLREIGPEDEADDEDMLAVGEIVAEWDRHDPRSTAFRYPAPAPGGIFGLHIASLASRMNQLDYWFGGLDGWLYELETADEPGTWLD